MRRANEQRVTADVQRALRTRRRVSVRQWFSGSVDRGGPEEEAEDEAEEEGDDGHEENVPGGTMS